MRGRNERGRAGAALALALVVVGVLAVLGLRVEDHLKPSTLRVPGTDFAAAEDIVLREFGRGVPTPILVRGPRGAVERDARALERNLDADRRIVVVAPWELPAEQAKALRPGPDRIVLIPRINTSRNDFEWVMPRLRRGVDESVHAPVRAHITGYYRDSGIG